MVKTTAELKLVYSRGGVGSGTGQEVEEDIEKPQGGETEARWKLSLQSQTGNSQTRKVAKIEF